MNKAQEILIVIAIVVIDLILVGGALSNAQNSLDPVLGFLSKDARVYVAILLTAIGGFFVLRGKK
jgi:hypothetical protein